MRMHNRSFVGRVEAGHWNGFGLAMVPYTTFMLDAHWANRKSFKQFCYHCPKSGTEVIRAVIQLWCRLPLSNSFRHINLRTDKPPH